MKRMNVRKLLALTMSAALLVGALTVTGFAEEAAGEGLGVVETAFGQAQGVPGVAFEGVTVFKGVPYAAPPVGDLRWAEPVDPEPWEGVRVFDTYGDAAMQWPNDMAAEPWKSDFYYEELPTFSEDCLYLNIATSAVTGDEKMPVYVWFHGGGLNHGFSYEVECDPEGLAAKGVVVVEVGTRLGVFGYMALPQLDEVSGYGASGNYGLMDSIKAVQWVKDNIAGFGGDPENITLGGQSGGTSKTAAFFASDIGAGLAKNVIWESGMKYNTSFRSLEAAEETSIAWLQACGLTGEESLEELRAMDASVFMGEESNYGKAPQAMVMDGKYIQFSNLKEAYAQGNLDGVNMIMGTNYGEGTEAGINGHTFETAEEFYAYYKELIGEELYEKYDFENLVQVTDEDAFATARILTTYGFYLRDARNVLLPEMLGAYRDENGATGKTYVYLFRHITPGRNDDYYWAWHSSELWYAFNSMRDIPEQREWTEWDHELAEMMSAYWANFMKTGDPNGEGLPEWLPSTAEQKAYLVFGDDLEGVKSVTDVDTLTELFEEYCHAAYGL